MNTTPKEIYNILFDVISGTMLKGVTVFREGCMQGILAAATPEKEEKEEKKEEKKEGLQYNLYEKELLDIESADRIRVVWKKAKLYLIVSKDEDDYPVEIFAKLPIAAGMTKDNIFNPVLFQEHTSNWDLVCRLISLLLRFGVPLDIIIKQLERSTYSMVDAAGVLKRVLQKYLNTEEDDDEEDDEGEGEGKGSRIFPCPQCGQEGLVYSNGCKTCRLCSYTTCG
jgi:ribonucleoside-diphosphate reductase alpha chain